MIDAGVACPGGRLKELLRPSDVVLTFGTRDLAVNPSEHFLKRAAECKRMAKATLEREDRIAWSQLAERWLACADAANNAGHASAEHDIHKLQSPHHL